MAEQADVRWSRQTYDKAGRLWCRQTLCAARHCVPTRTKAGAARAPIGRPHQPTHLLGGEVDLSAPFGCPDLQASLPFPQRPAATQHRRARRHDGCALRLCGRDS